MLVLPMLYQPLNSVKHVARRGGCHDCVIWPNVESPCQSRHGCLANYGEHLMNTAIRDTLRIGCGAGQSDDRIPPAVELARHGELDYLVFECLAERTIGRETLT